MLPPRYCRLSLATALCSLLLAGAATSQEASPEKARALLDQVKKSELERLIAAKQTEIERLKEDQSKTESDSSGLQKTIDSTTSLIADSGESLNKLITESRRLEHEQSVAQARIGAERLKIEGLRALSDAQGKSLSALSRHAEESAARSHVRTVELELLQVGKTIPGEGRDDKPNDDLSKSRKALTTAETKTQAEERAAHEAMKGAAVKMTAAEVRAVNAQRLADNDLTALPPIAEKPKKSSEKSDRERDRDRDGDAPVRRPQPARVPAPIAASPKPAATPAKPSRSIFSSGVNR